MNNMAVYLKENFQKIVDFFAVCVVFFIPISAALPNLFIILFSVLVLICLKQYIIVRPAYLIAIISSVFFILIESIVKNNFIVDLAINSRFLLLLLLIILFTQVKNIYKIEHAFILSTFIAITGSFVAIIKQILLSPNFLLDTGALINDFYDECGYHDMYMGSDVLTFLGY